MKWYRVRAIYSRHMLESRRNFERITDLVYWPLIDVLMWGFFSAYLARSGSLDPLRAEFLVVAAVFWSLFRGVQRDLAIGLLSELWARNLTSLLTTPLTLLEYMTGLTTMAISKANLSFLMAIVIAAPFYRLVNLQSLLSTAPFVVPLELFGLAVGIIVSGIVMRYSTRVQSVTWSVTGFLLPISCVFFPIAALPAFLKPVSRLLPTAQSFEGIRSVIGGSAFPWWNLSSGVALAIIWTVGATAFFDRIVRQARGLGLLVKPE